LKEAEKYTKINNILIGKCCRKYKYYDWVGGFKWSYELLTKI